MPPPCFGWQEEGSVWIVLTTKFVRVIQIAEPSGGRCDRRMGQASGSSSGSSWHPIAGNGCDRINARLAYNAVATVLPVLPRRVSRLEIAAIGVLRRELADSTASQVDRRALADLGRDVLDVGVVQVQPELTLWLMPYRWVRHETCSIKRCRRRAEERFIRIDAIAVMD
jgi:hypothetical protein